MTVSDEDAKAGRIVRDLLRSADRAVLSTRQRPDGPAAGWPYGSLVLLGCAPDASPILLISTLAEHTRNLIADARAGLLVDGTAGLDDPLTGARATVLGRLHRLEPEAAETEPLRSRYLRRHPSAAGYGGFADFGYWRMAVERAHLVAGFGRIHWIGAEAILGPSGLPLAHQEAEVVTHMNEEHADAIAGYATRLLGLPDGSWRLTGCDGEGVDLRLEGRTARLAFDKPVRDAEGARVELVRLARRARRTDGSDS